MTVSTWYSSHQQQDSSLPSLPLRTCSPELKALASRLAARSVSADPTRVADERKKRNYADFWTPIAANEPFRVVLSHMRDRWEAEAAGLGGGGVI